MFGTSQTLGQTVRARLHRHVWQRLPYHWRRNTLDRISRFCAPKPTALATPAAPIIVVGALNAASGLGQSARLCHDALKAQGLPVFGVDLTDALMQARDADGFIFADGRHVQGAGTLIVHVNAPLMPLALWSLGAEQVRHKHIVGYWAWELAEAPQDWRAGVGFVHKIWVPSHFTAAAMAPIARGRAVHVVPHPMTTAAHAGFRARPTGQPFTVLTMFDMASSFARKNPLAAVAAFRLAFGDDPTAHLIIKAGHATAYAEGRRALATAIGNASNISVIETALTAAKLNVLFDGADVLLSLHRSEGFGLALAEAMARGVPVVASDWSGNTDFLTQHTGMPVPYTLIAAEDAQRTYHHPHLSWADADVAAAAAKLQELRGDPIRARKLGAAGIAYVAQTWSPEIYAKHVQDLLQLDLLPARSD